MAGDLAAVVDALAARVAELVLERLGELQPREPLPALLTVEQLCAQLSVSRTTLHRLRAEGLPCIMIGDSPRGSLPEIVAWLRARGTAVGGAA